MTKKEIAHALADVFVAVAMMIVVLLAQQDVANLRQRVAVLEERQPVELPTTTTTAPPEIGSPYVVTRNA